MLFKLRVRVIHILVWLVAAGLPIFMIGKNEPYTSIAGTTALAILAVTSLISFTVKPDYGMPIAGSMSFLFVVGYLCGFLIDGVAPSVAPIEQILNRPDQRVAIYGGLLGELAGLLIGGAYCRRSAKNRAIGPWSLLYEALFLAFQVGSIAVLLASVIAMVGQFADQIIKGLTLLGVRL